MKKDKIIAAVLFLFVLFVYVFFARRGDDGNYMVHESDYFTHLAGSFLQGRLDLVNPGNTHDLSIYNGKMYLYWGPAPILLILPFLLTFGFNFSDCLYTAILGSFSALFVYFILMETDRLGWTALNSYKKAIISIFWALGTVYFVTSTMGGIWFTSESIAALFMLSALYSIIRYRNTLKLKDLCIAGFLFSMAVISRNMYIFYFPFFLAVIWFGKLRKALIPFLMVTAFFLAMFGVYNFLRFGSFFETGHSYHNMAGAYAEDKKNYGVWGTHYITRNFYYMFLNVPKLTSQFPFFSYDHMGNSYLFLSPLFILIFFVKFYNWRKKEFRVLNTIIIGTSILITLLLFNYFSTGYMQFGYRYVLDIMPLLILILAQVIPKVNNKIMLMLLAVSIYFNMTGACAFIKCQENLPNIFPLATIALGLILGILLTKKLLYAIPVGFIFLTAAVYFTSLLIGIGNGWLVGQLLVAVLILAYLLFRKPEIKAELLLAGLKDKVLVVLLILVGMVSWVMFDTHVIKNIKGDLYVGESTYGDLPFHLGIISEMAYADYFPPQNPLYKGTELAYPYYINLFSALLVKGGWSLRGSIIVPGMILMLSLASLIYEFTLRFTKNRAAGFIATILYLFNGGAGFYYFFKDNGFDFSNITKDYSHLFDKNIQWANFITRMMVPERSLLFGIPAGIIILLTMFFREANSLITKREVIVVAVLLGLMPILHTHTALSLVILLPLFFLLRVEKKIWKEQLKRFMAVVILAFLTFIPILPVFLQHVGTSSGFFKFHLWWMKHEDESVVGFWLKNTYLYIPYSLFILILPKIKRNMKIIQLGALVLFIVMNLVQFSPFDWDNVKFLFWAGLFWSVGVGVVFSDLFKRNLFIKGVAVFVLLTMISSALISLKREVNLKFVLFDKQTVELGEFIKKYTDKKSVFLTYKLHNSPAGALAGRPILLGYPGSLWVHGINYGDREKDVLQMFAGGENAISLLDKYQVNYVILGKSDPDFTVDRNFFERFPVIYKDNEHLLYKVK